MIRKLNRKTLFIILCFVIVVAVSSIITWAVRSTPTEPVAFVNIESENYNDPGSWTLKKSSSWYKKNKARITFDLKTVPKTNNHKKNVVFVIDNSESLNSGGRINTLKTYLKNLVDYILSDNNNKVALITFNSSSEVLSNFTNSSSTIKGEIDEIEAIGETNYNDALLNVDYVLNHYQYNADTDLVVVFFTDGKPTIDTPQQIVTYELLKDKYSYAKVKFNGVQYNGSSIIMDELEQITDEQFSADDLGLYTALLRASVEPYIYENFVVEDYIDSNYFELESIDKIYTSVGTANVSEENGLEKVTWNLGNEFLTGHNARLTIYVKLKDEYHNTPGLYTTNDHEKITYKLEEDNLTIKESDLSPVLKNYYTVTYDNNLPTGCTISSFPTETYTPLANVTIKQDTLSCGGYIFNGWEIVNSNVQRVGDDHFIMPEQNVTIRAIWSKPDISKSMDGTIHERTTLYKKVKDDALNTNYATTYTGQTNDGGGNEAIYYYKTTGASNYVSFADSCWRIVRTTDTGGVKLQYHSALQENGSCGGNNYGLRGINKWTVGTSSYYYGTGFEYDRTNNTFKLTGEINQYSWKTQAQDIVGKYTLQKTSATATNATMSYVRGIIDSNTAERMVYYSPYNTSAGSGPYNDDTKSLSSVGYMYNDVYDYDTKTLSTGSLDVIYSNSFAKTYYVGESYTLSGSNYILDNPYLISETDYDNGNLSSLVGKYTRRNTDPDSQGSSIYYIVAVEGTDIYYLQLSGKKDLTATATDIYFGDEIIDNGNNTYTLSGNISSINKLDWYRDYADSDELYTCNSDGLTCSTLYYVVNPTNKKITYEDGKRNYVYGNDFYYDPIENEYTLTDTTTFNGFTKNYNNVKNHHYTCFNTTGKCQTLSYIYYIKDAKTPYFIYLTGGESIADAIDNMLYDENVNTISSNIKQTLEVWFQERLTGYESYLEDIVYCNDRTISNLGGWDPESGVVTWEDDNVLLTFKGNSVINADASEISLYCQNQQDRFTKDNTLGNRKLSYPFGLETIEEAKLRDRSRVASNYRLGSAMIFDVTGAKVGSTVSTYGRVSSSLVNSSDRYMPVISLKPDTEYTTGKGTTASPYYIPTE